MILLFILLVIINVIWNLEILMQSIYDSLSVWFYSIYPSIFIFYNISNYLMYNYCFIKLSNLLKFFIKFDSDKSYVILLINIFLGNPGTANLLFNSLNNQEITDNDFKLLKNITFFMNPLFILNIFNIKIYLFYLLSSFIYIYIYSFVFNYRKDQKKLIINSCKKYSFGNFYESINNSINILLNVACMVTFFNITKTSIIYILNLINFNNSLINIVLSFLEVASGLKFLSSIDNIYLSILLISFQGLCILIQSFSYLNKKNISFLRYIFNNIFRSICVSIIFIILTILFHI